MPLTPSAGTCQAQISIPIQNPTIGIARLVYLIGATVVAGQTLGPAISITAGLTTAAQIQALISADATYLAYQAANPGFLITVTSFDGSGLTVIITKPSTVQITDVAKGVYSDFSQVTSAFVCNLTSGGGGSAGIAAATAKSVKNFIYPRQFCVRRSFDPNGNLIICPTEVYYPTLNGKKYILISSDNTQCCYKLKTP